MKFTVIENRNGALAKTMKEDGTTLSSATMTNGTYATTEVENLGVLNTCLDGLKHNQAILLGTNDIKEGAIVPQNRLEDVRKDNSHMNIVSRTKKYFPFGDESNILFDLDLDDGENVRCENSEDVYKHLCTLDPQFATAEILIRPSSSSYIYKDGIEVKGAGSYHAYVKCSNVKSHLADYIDNLIDKSYECGLGYYKVSKAGSLLKRQIFDSAVFSPERIIFEAGMICEGAYSQNKPKAFYKDGGYIDCSKLQGIDVAKMDTNIKLEKDKVREKAETSKANFIQTQTNKLMTNGYDKVSAEHAVNKFLEKQVLPLGHSIVLSSGDIIQASDIYLYSSKYNNVRCCDPIEPEKGSSKAIIYSNEESGLPLINSFVHGGTKYTIEIDYTTIYKLVNGLNISMNDKDKHIKRIKKLANRANLSKDERKSLSVFLKEKGLVSVNNALVATIDDTKEVAKMKGYVDFSPSGGILPTINNLKVLMENNGMTYEYDVILKKLDMKHSSVDYNAPSKDEALISTIETFASVEGISTGITNHLSALANTNNTNPLLDYIKSAHRKYLQNSTKNYIKELADIVKTNVETSIYVESIFMRWMIQCIACWDYERNYSCVGAKEKFESVLVLQGKQGVQKTKFFDALLPKEQQVYIKTGAMLNPGDKDSLMQNTSYGIVELGELDSTFNKSDIGALKAFLSNYIDEYRVPYGRVASKHKRCTSFCGSVNESGFLRDPTGARRFWVIPVVEIDFQKFETLDHDMFWGQAYEHYIKGDKWWFDFEDTEMNEEILKQHKEHESSSLAKDIFSTISHNNCMSEVLSVTEIFERFGGKTKANKTDINELSQLLKDNGYKPNSRRKFKVLTSFAENPLKVENNSSDGPDDFGWIDEPS